MSKTTKDLPEDIVVDILTRLPVKSLMRFKCVRKSWYALVIEDPNFISNHYLKQTTLNSNNYNNSHLLVQRLPYYTTDDAYFYALSTDTLCVYEFIRLTFFKNTPYQIVVLGLCNGIICLGGERGRLAFWNPATREFKIPQTSCIQRPPLTDHTLYDQIGFGFDPKTKDFKFVRFVNNHPIEGYGCVTQVELYTLSTDSWKELANTVERTSSFILFTSRLNTCMNGVYHWLASDGLLGDDLMVISFDMADEVFQSTPLPHLGASLVEYRMELALFNDTLAVHIYPREGNEKCFDLWVMKEYGVKESWTKQLTIGPIAGVQRPLDFWKNNGLFLENDDAQLVFYDPTTQELKNLQEPTTQELNNLEAKVYSPTFEVYIYVESLYRINGIQEHEDGTPSIRSQTTLKVCEATSNSA